MADLELRPSLWRNRTMYGLYVLTAGSAALLVARPPSNAVVYVFVPALLAGLWWFGIRRIRASWIRVGSQLLEVSDGVLGVATLSRNEITAVDAHPSDFPQLYGRTGRLMRLRPVWRREQLEALARELGVPICAGGAGCPRRG